MSQSNPQAGLNFLSLGLNPKILAVLQQLKFTIPTPIQHKAIPIAVSGKDVIGIAQTGTGKTLAFALPMLQHITTTQKIGLIILPTRELAIQVDEALQKLGQSFGLRRALVIGGSSMGRQFNDLGRRPNIIIGTPGRITDHIERRTLDLKNVGVLVLDEADRMLDMGFAPQIKRILQHVPKDRQTLLFSATMPAGIVQIASAHMKMPVRVEVAPAGSVAEKVIQELFIVSKEQKNRLLDKLLGEYKGTVLVFSRTKHGAKKICRSIQGMGHTAAEIHSNLSQSQRQRSLEGFKSGRYRVLVATDIAARGIDVHNIELVLNYDLPDNLDDYVHRIGRTARAGKEGQAISFVQPDQRGKIRMIERIVKEPLKITPLPELPAARPMQGNFNSEPQREQTFADGHRHVTFRRNSNRKSGHQGGGYKGNKPAHSGFGRKPFGKPSHNKRARVHL